MSEDTLTVVPHKKVVPEMEQYQQLATIFSQSALCPLHLRDKPIDCFFLLMYGKDIGLTPMQSMMGLYVVNGKIGLAADMAVARVRQSGVCEFFNCLESTPEKATYEVKRKDEATPYVLSFTIEEARKAGLVKSGGQYEKYPAQMLRARCKIAIVREKFSDIVYNVYDPEELGMVEAKPVKPAPATIIDTKVEEALSKLGAD